MTEMFEQTPTNVPIRLVAELRVEADPHGYGPISLHVAYLDDLPPCGMDALEYEHDPDPTAGMIADAGTQWAFLLSQLTERLAADDVADNAAQAILRLAVINAGTVMATSDAPQAEA